MKQYHYFVSYNYSSESIIWGYGNAHIIRSVKMNNAEEIQSVADFIKAEYNFKAVVILNFIRIKK